MESEIDKQRSKEIPILKEKSIEGFIENRQIKVIEGGKAEKCTLAVRKKKRSIHR